MNNPSFNQVSQLSHVGWGYLLTTLPAWVFHIPVYYPAIGVTIAAAIKEYLDAHGLETPEVAGNSWVDFGFYFLGVVIGCGVLLIGR